MNSCRIFDLGHCPPFEKCARLRTIESRKRAESRNCRGSFCASRRDSGLKDLVRRQRRHEKPVEAQCLTSVACCQCSYPNSQSLLSPIPKVAAALARQVNAAVNRISAEPIDSKALNLRPMPAAGVLGIDSGQLRLCANRKFKTNAQPGPPNSGAIPEKGRRDAHFIS